MLKDGSFTKNSKTEDVQEVTETSKGIQSVKNSVDVEMPENSDNCWEVEEGPSKNNCSVVESGDSKEESSDSLLGSTSHDTTEYISVDKLDTLVETKDSTVPSSSKLDLTGDVDALDNASTSKSAPDSSIEDATQRYGTKTKYIFRVRLRNNLKKTSEGRTKFER